MGTNRSDFQRWAHWSCDSGHVDRSDRLDRASDVLGHEVNSFSDLSSRELIEVIRDCEISRDIWPNS